VKYAISPQRDKLEPARTAHCIVDRAGLVAARTDRLAPLSRAYLHIESVAEEVILAENEARKPMTAVEDNSNIHLGLRGLKEPRWYPLRLTVPTRTYLRQHRRAPLSVVTF
jgi:hypothetical protein